MSQKYYPLVIFGGYSNSGKTTHLTPILKELGYTVLSSSVIHHDFCDRLIQEVFGVEDFDSYDRKATLEFKMGLYDSCGSSLDLLFSPTLTLSSRELLIDVAEKALKIVFGEEIYANRICDRYLEKPNDSFAIEAFNDKEAQLLIEKLSFLVRPKNINSILRIINLRRTSENPSVDSRTLIQGGIDIQNNSTYEDLRLLVSKGLSWT